jgi:putative component of membrane protein insertase Oxa1/YidC/SpoIIIJ protein YidD
MRYLLLAAVRGYWAIWPRHLNRGCLYRETCSHHVYRVACESGAAAGMLALLSRVRRCRPGYTVAYVDMQLGLILCDGSFLPGHLVAEAVLRPIHLAISEIEQHLLDIGSTVESEPSSLQMEPPRPPSVRSCRPRARLI